MRGFCFLLAVSAALHTWVSKPVNAQVVWSSITSDSAFFAELGSSDKQTFLTDFEEPFMVFLTGKPHTHYLSLKTIDARKTFMEMFWRSTQPNPIQKENLMLTAFIDRWKIVRKEFWRAKLPHIDDRAVIYLRYGKPFHRHQDFGGTKSVDLFTYDLMKKIYNHPPSQFYSVLPNESWGYENIFTDYVIHFESRAGTYRQIENLTDVLLTVSSKERVWYWAELVKTRAWISPVINKTALKLHQHELNLFSGLIQQGAFFYDFTPGLIKTTKLESLRPGSKIIGIEMVAGMRSSLIIAVTA